MYATLALFGRCQLLVDGTAVKFATEHSRALLAYLAIQPGVHERATLAALLWPERPDETARKNLRQTLVNLKQSICPFPQLNGLLIVTPKSIEVQAAALATDAQIFSQLWAACDAHTHPQLVACEECIPRLQQAAQLYTSEFLHGVFVKNSPLFEEWMLFLRERFHRQMLEILETLTSHDELVADYSQMQRNANRQLAMEPWREDAHRQLMRALALSGQGTAALAHYAVCRRILAKELGVLPSPATTALYEQIKRGELDGGMRGLVGGEIRAQGIQTQERRESSSQVGSEGTTESGYPLPIHLAGRAPQNLPRPLTPFIGREQEIEEVAQRLADPDTRLLTLVGLGGIGKTRLAIEAAQKLTAISISDSPAGSSPVNGPFGDGIFFVSLAPLLSSAMLVPAIAATLNLDLGSDPLRTVINHVRDKALLLILDNFEHVLDGMPLVVDILEQAPRVQVLATSRERLHVRGEQLYPVPPLTHAQQGELAEATTWSAVCLFVERARRVSPNFKATESNLPALLRICGLVQGMPLGLEMAAARCDVLSLDEIAAEIERSLDFLSIDYYDLPERQQSMGAVLDWSWRLLREDEALVLRQLAVFRGGFTRHAAETICGASLQVLSRLVDKSVLRRSLDTNENPGKDTGRYEFHPLLWQFAQEKLKMLPEELTRSATRHSNFYLAFVAERERRLMRHEPRQAMMEIQAELDNVRQAWRWAVSNHAGETLDLGAYGLWQFYTLAGLTAEAIQAFCQAATALQGSAAAGQAESTAQRHRHILSKLWALSAHLLSAHGNYDEAIENAQRAMTLATLDRSEATSRQAAALGRVVLGQTLYLKHQFSESRTHLEQVLQATQDEIGADEIWAEIRVGVRLYLGAIARINGKYLLAKSYLVECLQISQSLGKLRSEVHAQLNLGFIEWFLHEEESARQAYEQALSLSIALRYRWGEGTARHELSIIHGTQGEYSLAIAHCRQGLTLFMQIDEALKQVHVLAELIQFHGCLGQFGQAVSYQAHLATVLQQLKSPEAVRLTLVAGARLANYQENYKQAFEYAHQLWKLLEATDSRLEQAEALTLLGQAQSTLHQYAAAAESYIQALTLYQELGAQVQAAEAQAGLASISLAQDDHLRALQFTEAVLATLEQYPNARVYEPFAIYLTCYRVLATQHDPRAHTFLKRAYALLQNCAAHIDDEELRESYLQNVSVHRQLVAAYAEAAKQMV